MPLGGLLGLARRGGRLAMGHDAVLRAVAARQAHLLLLATDASPRVVRRTREAAEAADVPLIVWSTKSALGALLGRRDLAVLAVCDAGFADALMKRYQQARPKRPHDATGPDPNLK